MKSTFASLYLVLLLLGGCTAQTQVVSKSEIKTQNQADAVVSQVLFDHDLSTQASYNVRKNGMVVIRFEESVPAKTYTEVVELLRANPAVHGVQAEQGGMEVCPSR